MQHKEIQIHADFLLNAAQFVTINWLYEVEMSQVDAAAVNIAEGHLKDVLYIYYHA